MIFSHLRAVWYRFGTRIRLFLSVDNELAINPLKAKIHVRYVLF